MGVLDGRVVVVTGAGRGLGRAHALLLAAEGASVVVNDLGTGPDGSGCADDPAAEVVAEIESAGGSAVANRDDVAPGPGLDDNASGTAALVELTRDLAGVERARALVLASTDGGTVGQAGNERLLAALRAAEIGRAHV